MTQQLIDAAKAVIKWSDKYEWAIPPILAGNLRDAVKEAEKPRPLSDFKLELIRASVAEQLVGPPKEDALKKFARAVEAAHGIGTPK